MAGDWIKMRTDLAEDPAVISIAAACDLDEDAVVGKLHRLWSWADRQSRDGHACVTLAWVDRHVACDGFADAMSDAGWLDLSHDGDIAFPNWETHNSKSSKVRSQAQVRQQKRREKPVTQPSRTKRDKSVTREEKRREEKSKQRNPLTPFDQLPEKLGTDAFRESLAEWVQHRQEIRKPLTATSAKQQLRQFETWGPAKSIEVIRYTVAKGWQGLREPDAGSSKVSPVMDDLTPEDFV
jgi:hypothetical protein